MVKISVSEELTKKVPEICLSCIECEVIVGQPEKELQDLIGYKAAALRNSLKMEEISQLPAISDSRKAYRSCGKDPARYRPSAEALMRRLVKGAGIYSINNVVDLLNLVSFTTGFSIGGYDADKLCGNVVFGIGESNESYQGVGRGFLNIEGLPVFRDDSGAFGSPTSDSERTSVTMGTGRFLMVIVGFGHCSSLREASEFAVDLLEKYASAQNFELQIINSANDSEDM